MTRALAALALIATAALLLARLDCPRWDGVARAPRYLFDETYNAFTAHRFALGDPRAWEPRARRLDVLRFATDDVTPTSRYEWVHPPTATLVMASAIRLFGWSAVAARLGSVVSALVLLVFTVALGLRLGGPRVGVLAGVLVATDGVFFVFARTAVPQIYMAALTIAAAFWLHCHLTDPTRHPRAAFATGALVGLAVSVKWTAAPVALVFALIALAPLIGAPRRGNGRVAAAWARWSIAFVILPPAVYVVAYAPFFWSWHYGWHDFISLQRQMWWFHHHMPAVHPDASAWFTWALPQKLTLGSGSATPLAATRWQVVCVGNPLLWCALVPSLAWTALRFARRPGYGDALLLIAVAAVWLPWSLIHRFGFFYHLLPALPFSALAFATLVDDVGQRWPRLRAIVPPACIAAAVLGFAYLYPVLSAWSLAPASLARFYPWLS